ncbi:MAG: glycoside hydrolase family 3 C-terminal domain-containing protein [Ruminococcus sp.]|nr:glycoside hydrolase family 3 C-terminal domain-containing protein [Ruminococcus sp.]
MIFRNNQYTPEERLADLLSRLTLDEKVYMLSTHQHAVPRLGIGEWYVGCEVARGFVSKNPDEPSTVFPQPIGLASTFDPELMHTLGEIAGNEARCYYQQRPDGRLMLWGPTVDPERDPRWGRTEEGYGEDPYLIGEMTKAYTRGLAGDDPYYLKTVPTLKHFCANNNEEQRINCSADVTMRTLHEYYYEAFRIPITEGGAHSIMCAYNELGGVPACMNPDLQPLVKDTWGLDFVVTDGADFSQNVLAHRSHRTHAEALAACIKSGTDVMTDNSDMVAAAAYDALKRNLLTEEDIDRTIGRSLAGRMRLGEFDEVHPYKNMQVEADSEESRKVNRRAAMEQMCLLKNTGILPLQKGKKIAVIGPIADENYRDWYTGVFSYAVSIRKGLEETVGAENVLFDNGYDIAVIRSCKNGRYLSVLEDGQLRVCGEEITAAEKFELHDWDFGSLNLKSCLNGKYVTENGTYKAISETPYEWFIREWFKPTRLEDGTWRYRAWFDWDMDIAVDEEDHLIAVPSARPSENRRFEQVIVENGAERAAALAGEADYAIVCLGNHPMQVARECYDRKSLALPRHQQELIRAVFAANPNTILVVAASYPFSICEEQEKLPAIVYTTHAGAELGTAVAATLMGENNPAARCPLTWYRSEQELPDILEYDIIGADSTYLYYTGKPLYAFGHGLSYSSFRYDSFTVETVESGIRASVTVENTSDTDGDEVVQIYFRPENPSVKRPIKQLCGFRRVHIPAHERVCVTIEIPRRALEFYDVSREKRCVEEGCYTFMAGASSEDIRLIQSLFISGEVIPPRDLSRQIRLKNYDSVRNGKLSFTFAKNDWYVQSGDWGSSVILKNAAFEGYTLAEVQAAAPCDPGKVSVYAGERLLGETEIKPSACPDDFSVYRIPLESFSGRDELCLELKGGVSVYSLQLS